MSNSPIRIILQISFATALGMALAVGQTPPPEPTPELDFRIQRRIFAHGDEFNAVATDPSNQRLFIGTEAGKVVVWDISAKREERTLVQGSPVHRVIALRDGDRILAGGGEHDGSGHSGALVEWNLNSGHRREFSANAESAILDMAIDAEERFAAAIHADGVLRAWDIASGEITAEWKMEDYPVAVAVAGRSVFCAAVSRSVFKEPYDDPPANEILKFSLDDPRAQAEALDLGDDRNLWSQFSMSPDGHFLSANYDLRGDDQSSPGIAIIDIEKGTIVGKSHGNLAIWFAPDRYLAFEREVLAGIVQVSPESVEVIESFEEGSSWHSSGSIGDLSGVVANHTGDRYWGVFRVNAGLVEWATRAPGEGEVLTATMSMVFAMDAALDPSGGGKLLTGGDDGYVRLWDLEDLRLIHEFVGANGVPQGVAILSDHQRAIISYGLAEGAMDVYVADLVTGQQRKLLSADHSGARVFAAGEDFVYIDNQSIVVASPETGETIREMAVGAKVDYAAVSKNGQTIVVATDDNRILAFQLESGMISASLTAPDNITRLAISSNGRYAYTTEFLASLKKWDLATGKHEELSTIGGQAVFLGLSDDESKILVGGNHRDFSVINASDGTHMARIRPGSADFYVTNLWLVDDRLIATTDTGSLYDGKLQFPPSGDEDESVVMGP